MDPQEMETNGKGPRRTKEKRLKKGGKGLGEPFVFLRVSERKRSEFPFSLPPEKGGKASKKEREG